MMLRFWLFLNELLESHPDEDSGATMVEYGLIVSVIALVVVVGATAFGLSLREFFENLWPGG